MSTPGSRVGFNDAAALSQTANHLVDFANRLARYVLDGAQRHADRVGIAVLEEPRGTRRDEDHVKGMSCGVVPVARDPHSLLSHRESLLAFGVAFSPLRTLAQIGDR